MKMILRLRSASLLPTFLFLALLGLFVGLLLLSPAPTVRLFSVPSAQASPMQLGHLVGAGDDLHLLAAYYYGDARQWERIYQANRHQIKNPNRISTKQVLRIDLPDGWKPPMPFSAWKERVIGAPSPKEEAPAPGETPPPPEKPAAEEPKR